MNMRTGIYHSHETDSFLAGETAANVVLDRLRGAPPAMLMLFASVGHDLPRLLEGIDTVLPNVPLCGCSGAGIIHSSGCDEATHSIVLLALTATDLHCSPFLFGELEENPERVGALIGEHVVLSRRETAEESLLFLFTDGLTVNADALFRGIKKTCPDHIDIVGGTAGNDFQHHSTYQFSNNQVVRNGVCGMLMQGSFTYQLGVTHGSKPVGLMRTITRSSGNVILEIDNLPALDILKQFIGSERVHDFGQTLNLFELGEEFCGHGYSENILNRAIIGIDEERNGIRLAVEIAEGTNVRITRRDADLVLSRTREMGRLLTRNLRAPTDATYFFFNCCGRGSYLFGDPEPDVEALKSVLGPESAMIGFFTFGEFAPIKQQNYFHNYTGVLLGIEE